MDQIPKSGIIEPGLSKELVFTGVEGGQEWTICCWDLKSRTIKTSYKGSSSRAQTLSVVNGEYVISADTCKPLIHVWALNRRDHYLRIRSPGVVTALCVSSDGIYCAAATSYKIYIWLVSTGELMSVFDSNQVNYLRFTRNSKYLLSGGSTTVFVWPLARILSNHGSDRGRVEYVYKFTHGNSVTGLVSGIMTVLTSADRTVNTWSLRDGSLVRTVVLDSPTSALEWGSKEDRAYAGTYDGDIYEINTLNEKEDPKKFVYIRGEKKQQQRGACKRDRRVTCLSLSLDCRILVAGSLKGKVYLWNTHTKHLVTSIRLNANSMITCCLVTSVPLNFGKPIHPFGRFQEIQVEAAEGKVKALLQRQKNDLNLNLELSDKFEKFVTKGLTLLEEFGKGANKAEHYAKNWTRLTEQLLSGLHEALDQLYCLIEPGSMKYQRPPPGQVTLKPCPEDSVERFATVRLQFERLCTALSVLLSGFGLEVPVVVDFPLKYVLDLLCRAAAVTPPRLLKKPTPERINLAEVVPYLHVAALEVLNCLVLSAKSLLLPYAEIVNNLLLLQCLGWSRLKDSGDDTSRKQLYSELRSQVYKVVQTSLIYGISGDAKSFASFFKDVSCEAMIDAKPLINSCKRLETRSEQVTNRANSYWLQVAKSKMKSKNLPAPVNTEAAAAADSKGKMFSKEEALVIQKLNISALKVLRRLVGCEGRLLSRCLLEKIVELLGDLYPKLETEFSSSVSTAFQELVTSVVMVANSLPFPLELPLEVTTPRTYNDDAEELREFYVLSLRRCIQTVTAEESIESVHNHGEVVQCSGSGNKEKLTSLFQENISSKRKVEAVVHEDTLTEQSESQAKKAKLEKPGDSVFAKDDACVPDSAERLVSSISSCEIENESSFEVDITDSGAGVIDLPDGSGASVLPPSTSCEASRTKTSTSPDVNVTEAESTSQINSEIPEVPEPSYLDHLNNLDAGSEEVQAMMKAFVSVDPDK